MGLLLAACQRSLDKIVIKCNQKRPANWRQWVGEGRDDERMLCANARKAGIVTRSIEEDTRGLSVCEHLYMLVAPAQVSHIFQNEATEWGSDAHPGEHFSSHRVCAGVALTSAAAYLIIMSQCYYSRWSSTVSAAYVWVECSVHSVPLICNFFFNYICPYGCGNPPLPEKYICYGNAQ